MSGLLSVFIPSALVLYLSYTSNQANGNPPVFNFNLEEFTLIQVREASLTVLISPAGQRNLAYTAGGVMEVSILVSMMS